MQQTNELPNGSSSAFTLRSALLILGVLGVIFRVLSPLVRAVVSDRVDVDNIAIAMALGLFLSVVVGGTVGLFHHRRGQGVLTGLIVGVFVGPLIGAATMVPARATGAVFLGAFGGSAVLLLFGAMSRLYSTDKPMHFIELQTRTEHFGDAGNEIRGEEIQ